MNSADTDELTRNSMPACPGPRLLALLLVLAVWAIYWPVRTFDFVNLDDNQYVYEHPVVSRGLSWDGVKWAFQADLAFETEYADYWMPLVILSRMLDVSIFGLSPSGSHVVNVLFHTLNAVLVFFLWLSLTRQKIPSVFIAALFAVHPLHVESVAWISERKDCLSATFALLTLLAYARYLRAPSCRRYLLVFLPFILGLMAKPLAVTLPGIMLMLDLWPARRLVPADLCSRERRPAVFRILVEKIPFGLLALLAIGITFRAQSQGGAFSADRSGLSATNLANALASYSAYLGKLFCPVRLAVMYPWTQTVPVWQVLTGGILLLGVSGLVLWQLKSRPYFASGWFWFVGGLLPFIGILQFGPQRMADRFVYIPFLGLYAAIVWSVFELYRTYPSRRLGLGLFGAGLLAVCVLACRASAQVRYWRDSTSLFQHAVEVTRNNYLAHNNLAAALQQRGDLRDAESHYRTALAIWPDYPEALIGLGGLEVLLGDPGSAVPLLSRALTLVPHSFPAQMNLAQAWLGLGKTDRAETIYRSVLAGNPNCVDALHRLGLLRLAAGDFAAAGELLMQAATLAPGDPSVLEAFGACLWRGGHWPEAADCLRRALQQGASVNPAGLELAWILAVSPDPSARHPAEAAALIQGIRDSGVPMTAWLLDVAAAVAAANGDFVAAADLATQALTFPDAGDAATRAEIERRKSLYLNHCVYIEGDTPAGSSPVHSNDNQSRSSRDILENQR